MAPQLDNLLQSMAGTVRLCDFGVAAVFLPGQRFVDRPGTPPEPQCCVSFGPPTAAHTHLHKRSEGALDIFLQAIATTGSQGRSI